MGTLELAILVSGEGTNLQAILDAIASGGLEAKVKLVVSNRHDAYALERARKAGVLTRVVPHAQFPTRESFDRALAEAVAQVLDDPARSLIVLAGFMRVLSAVFLDAFPHRVINIHPALLPSFPGTHSQERALAYGVKLTGCTVHVVDAGTDTGPVIAQAAVPVLEDDTAEALGARILVQEHRLLVDVIRWFAEGRVEMVTPAERLDGGTAASSPDAPALSAQHARTRARVRGVATWRFAEPATDDSPKGAGSEPVR